MILPFLGTVLFVCFLLIVLRGAPYVPTRTRDMDALFALHDFKTHELLVDLGSGDGRVLIAAAKQGVKSIGYELNPLLAGLTWLRLRPYKKLATVRCQDFWLTPLPKDTAAVFVFLAEPFMHKLDRYLAREAARLGHEVTLISYGVKVKSRSPQQEQGSFLVYRYEP